MIDAYEASLIREAELQSRNQQQQAEAEARHRAEQERVRFEAKKRRVLENDFELKELRRVIANAQTSKANFMQIQENKKKAEEFYQQEKQIEL